MTPRPIDAFALVLLAVAQLATRAAAAAAEPGVRVVGVRVAADFPGRSLAFRPLGAGDPGIAIDLLVSGEHLVAVDLDGSRIVTLADDRGVDLLGAPAVDGGGFAPFPRLADDGSAALVTVRSPIVPKAGAVAVSVAGLLRLRCGGTTTVTETAGMTLAKGATIAWGADKTLTVSRVDGSALTVTTTDELDDLASLAFIDAAGVDHLTERRSSTSFVVDGKRTTTIDYDIDAPQPTMTARATWWRDLQRRALPFTVVATIGER